MKRTKYQNLINRMYKKFHNRRHGESWAGMQANVEMYKYKHWFTTAEQLEVFIKISHCLDDMANNDKQRHNVYALFRQVEDF